MTHPAKAVDHSIAAIRFCTQTHQAIQVKKNLVAVSHLALFSVNRASVNAWCEGGMTGGVQELTDVHVITFECDPGEHTKAVRPRLADHRVLPQAVRGGRIHRLEQTALPHPSMETSYQAAEFPRVRPRFVHCHGGFVGLGFAQHGRPEQARSTASRALVSGRGSHSIQRRERQTHSRPRGLEKAGFPHRESHGDWHHVAGQDGGSRFPNLGTASQA